MKKYFLYLLTLLFLLSTGCTKEWLDVNTDPNNPSDASPELVLPAGIVSIASQTGGYYSLIGGFWSQYWSQSNAANQYKEYDSYNLSASDVEGMWNEMYSGGLNDLQFVINKSKETGNNPMLFMATVMQAYGYAFLVDYNDKIPYTEALKGTASTPNFNPKYDDGKAIYTDLIRRIDSTMALDLTATLTPDEKSADVVFGGDMNKWIAFANTLKLKMYLRMAYSDPSEAQAGVEALYTAGATFLTEDASVDIFVDEKNHDNPLYSCDKRNLNVGTNLRVSQTIYAYLDNRTDPRLATLCEDPSKTSPIPQGGFNIPQTELDKDAIPVFKLSPTAPVYFISLVESEMLQAEAIARYGVTGDDKALYDDAIQQDFTRRGVGSAASFTGTGGVYEYPSLGTKEEKIEAIINAKWVAFAGNETAEAFFDHSRTGYPAMSTEVQWVGGNYNPSYVEGFVYSMSGATSGVYPTRLLYPQSEVNLNTNFPGQTKITDPVWWDKN